MKWPAVLLPDEVDAQTVFERRPERLWNERIWQRETAERGWALGVLGA